MEGLQLKATDSVLVVNGSGVVKYTSLSELTAATAIRTETANYTVLSGDATILVDPTAALVTVTLPEASVVGKKYIIKKIDSGNKDLVLTAAGGVLIDGYVNRTTDSKKVWVVQFDGTNWYVVSRV